jgi:putative oxidoreductase
MDPTLNEPMDFLRVLCGAWFLPHVIGKIRNFDAAASNSFAKAGMRPPKLFTSATIALEIVATVGLVFHIYPMVAAGCAVIVLLGASYAVVRINGFNWRWQRQGPEYMIFWAMACVLSVLPRP